ncbi:8763_t:CDS:2, partial [Ambispora leptoticha]
WRLKPPGSGLFLTQIRADLLNFDYPDILICLSDLDDSDNPDTDKWMTDYPDWNSKLKTLLHRLTMKKKSNPIEISNVI